MIHVLKKWKYPYDWNLKRNGGKKGIKSLEKGCLNCVLLNINKYVPFKTLGNKDITWVMLEAGAETDVVNSVGRTAAQMAAFVGEILLQFYIRLYPKFPL